jgi:peptidyl-tRNA hydrolase
MSDVKMAIVCRRDMRLDKAQFAEHASRASLLFLVDNDEAERIDELKVNLTPQEIDWLQGGQINDIRTVGDEEALKILVTRARSQGISTYEITGSFGKNGDQLTCVALGPDDASLIDFLITNTRAA